MMLKKTALLAATVLILNAAQNCLTFTPILKQTRFLLVVDISGSMSGQPLADAQQGLLSFVAQMGSQDQAGLLSFSDGISYDVPLTTNKKTLKKAIKKLQSGGGTHLYDALARAVSLAGNSGGKVALVALTDGQDSGSRFTAGQVESMAAYQGVAFFAIGLGSVNSTVLSSMAAKANGEFQLTPNSSELTRLYQNALAVYRHKHLAGATQSAELIVHSMPAGKTVMLDGREFGNSPLKLINIQPGEHEVQVGFDQGPWKCVSTFPAGQTGLVQAAESEVDKNIAIISIPHGSAVFLDNEFQGYTSDFGKRTTEEEKGFIFKRKVKRADYSRELILQNVPPGKHELTILPFAGSSGEGMFEGITHEFNMGTENLIMNADMRTGEVSVRQSTGPLQPKPGRFDLNQSTIFDDF